MKYLALLLVAVPLGAQTLAECQEHVHRGRKPQARSCFEGLAVGRDPYLKAEGLWGLGMTQDANTQFRTAVAAKGNSPDLANIKTRWGRLLLEGFAPKDASTLFIEALELKEDYPPALVGMAMVASETFEAKAVELVEKALKKDPKHLEAQEMLARLAVEDIDFEKARTEAEKALKISPESLDAMAVMAALEALSDRSPQPWLAKMEAINPVYAEGYTYLGHTLSQNRRYLDAIDYFKQAIAKDSKYWAAHSELGITYMRLAMEKQAREHLELAYENGYRNNLTVNSLRLMDSYKNFDTFKTATTEVRLHKKESALLRLYIESELQRAMSTYEKKYKFKLADPVRVEVYPDHEDFAVRTMAMPGLGALGVAFGNVLAMDSPSGRPPGSFHWASTLWHELSHVYVLTATKHRVPRWFTEGLAVHEETAASPDWGDRLDPTVLRAVKTKKLLPIAQLDRGFIRPTYPNQVIVSYFQAGRICDYINGRWGFQKLLDMMNDFAKNQPTPAVVEKNLGMKPEQFDKEFFAWLDKQLETPLAKFEDWSKQLKAVNDAAKAKNWDEVIKVAAPIRDWFPEFVEHGNLYEALADAYFAKNDKKAATAQLEAYAKVGGRAPDVLKKLAGLQQEQGRPKEAMLTLEKVNYIYPMADPEMHRKLGELYLTHGSTEKAIREFQASLASKPPDPVVSHYQLAQAYLKANNADKAYDHVLEALEAAPGYRPAQKLLEELSSKRKEAR